MKRSLDVLIVGGGIIVCSIAYYLRKQGVGVIVPEKGDIGAQGLKRCRGTAGAQLRLSVSASCGSFDALLIVGSMAQPPGRL